MSKKTLILFFLIVSLAYYSLATAFSFTFDSNKGYYGLLANSFIKGKNYLLINPPPELLTLQDPYDPIQNRQYRLQDASLYKGKYYLYWGPIPAITRIIFLNKLPEQFFIYLYVLGCTLVAFLTLKKIRDAFFWKIADKYLFVLSLVIGFNGIVINLLSCFGIYYEAIAAAQFFLLCGIYFYCEFMINNKYHSILISNIFFALSIASRISYIFPIGIILIFTIIRLINKKQCKIKNLLFSFSPIAIIFFILAMYNYLRFNNYFEFGTSYQLAGVNIKTLEYTSIRYMPNNLKNYIFSLPLLKETFPFIFINPKYQNIERLVFSFFLISPISLFIFFINRQKKKLNTIYLSLLLTSVTVLISLSYLMASATRYMFDFIYMINIAGAINILFLLQKRKTNFLASNVLIITGLLITIIISFLMWISTFKEYHNSQYLRLYNHYLKTYKIIKINNLFEDSKDK